MKLSEVINDLFYGELNSLKIAEDGIELLLDKNLERMVFNVNNALNDLHTRFRLIERAVTIESLVWKSNYVLDAKHSFLNPDPDEIKYIRDSPWEKFTNDVIKIIGVRNEVGQDLPLNNGNEWASVFTPSYNVVQLTHPYYSQAFEVSYQASHPVLLILDTAEETLNQEINLAPVLREVLLTKIASRYFSGMSGQEASMKSQELTVKYEQKCLEISQTNQLADSENITNIKPLLRGFP